MVSRNVILTDCCFGTTLQEHWRDEYGIQHVCIYSLTLIFSAVSLDS